MFLSSYSFSYNHSLKRIRFSAGKEYIDCLQFYTVKSIDVLLIHIIIVTGRNGANNENDLVFIRLLFVSCLSQYLIWNERERDKKTDFAFILSNRCRTFVDPRSCWHAIGSSPAAGSGTPITTATQLIHATWRPIVGFRNFIVGWLLSFDRQLVRQIYFPFPVLVVTFRHVFSAYVVGLFLV